MDLSSSVSDSINNVLEENEGILAYQLNCHHSMAPVINLNSWLIKKQKKSRIVAFIHEPYLSGGKMYMDSLKISTFLEAKKIVKLGLVLSFLKV